MENKTFFDNIKKFKIKQEKQKQRGLNDFNLLSTVRKYHDEVYLHSTMIGALLDPKGLHYQGTLFLEKFLEVLNLDDFELDFTNVTVGVEYHDIDLYITDGTKHIIIENKIWAKDQECQIIKYINIIKEKNDLFVDDTRSPNLIEDIYVIYLTPNNKIPSEHEVSNGYISFSGGNTELEKCSKRPNTKSLVKNNLKNYQVKYQKINYKNDVLNWLGECLKEVQNITNLNESIKQYIDVVKMVNNNYKGKVKTMEIEISKVKENYKIAKEIEESLPKLRDKTINKFFETTIISLKSELGDEWTIKREGNLQTAWGFPLRIYKNKWNENKNGYLLIGFEFQSKNYNNGFLGVVRSSKKIIINDIVKKFKFKISAISDDIKRKETYNISSWWMYGGKNSPVEGDFVEQVLFNDYKPESFVVSILKYVDELETKTELLTLINAELNNDPI